eukprot:gene1402-7947_t
MIITVLLEQLARDESCERSHLNKFLSALLGKEEEVGDCKQVAVGLYALLMNGIALLYLGFMLFNDASSRLPSILLMNTRDYLETEGNFRRSTGAQRQFLSNYGHKTLQTFMLREKLLQLVSARLSNSDDSIAGSLTCTSTLSPLTPDLSEQNLISKRRNHDTERRKAQYWIDKATEPLNAVFMRRYSTLRRIQIRGELARLRDCHRRYQEHLLADKETLAIQRSRIAQRKSRISSLRDSCQAYINIINKLNEMQPAAIHEEHVMSINPTEWSLRVVQNVRKKHVEEPYLTPNDFIRFIEQEFEESTVGLHAQQLTPRDEDIIHVINKAISRTIFWAKESSENFELSVQQSRQQRIALCLHTLSVTEATILRISLPRNGDVATAFLQSPMTTILALRLCGVLLSVLNRSLAVDVVSPSSAQLPRNNYISDLHFINDRDSSSLSAGNVAAVHSQLRSEAINLFLRDGALPSAFPHR